MRDLPPSNRIPRNLGDDGLVPIFAESVEIASWSLGEVGSNVPATEVHLAIPIPSLGISVRLRHQSRKQVLALIAALEAQANDVWP